jgi:hypothetical protein
VVKNHLALNALLAAEVILCGVNFYPLLGKQLLTQKIIKPQNSPSI